MNFIIITTISIFSSALNGSFIEITGFSQTFFSMWYQLPLDRKLAVCITNSIITMAIAYCPWDNFWTSLCYQSFDLAQLGFESTWQFVEKKVFWECQGWVIFCFAVESNIVRFDGTFWPNEGHIFLFCLSQMMDWSIFLL